MFNLYAVTPEATNFGYRFRGQFLTKADAEAAGERDPDCIKFGEYIEYEPRVLDL